MSLPSPSITPPVFTSFPQAYFQGVYFGGTASPFQFRGDAGSLGIAGLDMPSVNNSDPETPRVHGQYIGLDTLSGRDITVTLDVGAPFGSYTNLAGAMAALRTALSPSGTTENPFFVQLSADSPQLVTLCRPRKRSTLVDVPYVFGNLAQNVAILFHATDPTLYAAGTLSPSVGVPAPLGGFTFNLSFPLSFGGGSEAGLITAVNYGDLPCYPLITFTGPCTYPTLTNDSIVNSPFVQFGMSLNSGDQLVVNTDPKYRSAVYTAAGTSQGSSRLFTLSQASSWWALPPDSTSVLSFTTLDVSPVSGTCTVEYSSAYSAAS